MIVIRTLKDIKFKVKIAGRCIGNYSFDHIYGKNIQDSAAREAYISTFTRYFEGTFYLIYVLFALGILEKGLVGILSNFVNLDWYWYYYSFTRHGLLLITAGSLFLAIESLLPGISSNNSLFSERWFEEDSDQRIQAVTILGAALISIGAALQFLGTFPPLNRYESPAVLFISIVFLLLLVSLYMTAAEYDDEDVGQFFIQWAKTDLDPKKALYAGVQNTFTKGGLLIIILFSTFDILGSALIPGTTRLDGQMNIYVEGFTKDINPIFLYLLSIFFLLLSVYILAITVEAFTDPEAPPLTVVKDVITQIHIIKYFRIIISGASAFLYQIIATLISLPVLLFAINNMNKPGTLTGTFILLIFVFIISIILPSGLLLIPYVVGFFDLSLLEAGRYVWEITYGYKRSIFYIYYLAIMVGFIIILILLIPVVVISFIHVGLSNIATSYVMHVLPVYILSVFAEIFLQLNSLNAKGREVTN